MMRPRVRKGVLSLHLVLSTGWIGSVIAYLSLGLSAVNATDDQDVRAAWIGMELIGWSVIVPLALGSLITGVFLGLGTRWGLFDHYWVLISLALTAVSAVILILHMPSVSAAADVARVSQGPELRALGGDLLHPSAGLVILLLVQVLNVFKPAGLTVWGWRKQQRSLESTTSK